MFQILYLSRKLAIIYLTFECNWVSCIFAKSGHPGPRVAAAVHASVSPEHHNQAGASSSVLTFHRGDGGLLGSHLR